MLSDHFLRDARRSGIVSPEHFKQIVTELLERREAMAQDYPPPAETHAERYPDHDTHEYRDGARWCWTCKTIVDIPLVGDA